MNEELSHKPKDRSDVYSRSVYIYSILVYIAQLILHATSAKITQNDIEAKKQRTYQRINCGKTETRKQARSTQTNKKTERKEKQK